MIRAESNLLVLALILFAVSITGCTDDPRNEEKRVNETTDPGIPLCEEWEANPEDLENAINIHCLIERGEFADPDPQVPDVLRVVDWNIERGHRIDDILNAFQTDPVLATADIILLQEADRGCPRTGRRNITREIAETLAMDYVYAVEFVEIGQERCEHGNAILSRFPLGEADQLRHTDFEKWYEEGRLGGRVTIRADVLIDGLPIRIASVHYMSSVLYYFKGHQAQTGETLDFIGATGGPVIWGGDLNTGIYYVTGFEPSIELVFEEEYDDGLAGLPHMDTWTSCKEPPIPRMRLDWIFSRGLGPAGGRVLYEEHLGDLSDHLGIYADFRLD